MKRVKIMTAHKRRWSDNGIILHSLSLGSILGFVGLFIMSISQNVWMNENAVNITFMLVGFGLLVMSKVGKDRGRWLLNRLTDKELSNSDVSYIIVLVMGILAILVGALDMIGALAIYSEFRAVVTLIIILVLSFSWIGSLRRELK